MLDRARLVRGATPRRLAAAIVALAALAAVLVWAWQAASGPTVSGAAAPAAVPPIEQLPARPDTLADQRLAPITPDEARRRNAAVPFADPDPRPAAPFRFAGSALDR